MPPFNLPTGETPVPVTPPAPAPAPTPEPVAKIQMPPPGPATPVQSTSLGMSKKEEIILAFLIAAGIITAIWGIVWATHQTGNSNASSSQQSTEQTAQESPRTIANGIPIGGPAVLDEAWTRFTDTKNRFTIDGPDIARIITDKGAMAAVGYQPTCNSDTGTVCVYLPDTTFYKTNFNGAGVSVNTTTDNTVACLGAKNSEVKGLSPRVVGDVSFASFTTSDAAMSHQSSGSDYRTYRNGACYEITTRINSSTFDVYKAGSISRFTDEERTTTNRILEKIVSSFRFLQ